MEQTFAGRAVVITGGTGGLGSAVVQALLDAGATCHVTWLHDRELSRFEQKDRATLHQVDCRDENAVVGLYQKVGKLWASLHIIGGFAMGPVEKTSAEDFRGMFEMNAMTCFLCSREAIKSMRQGGDGGRIVNVAARPAVVPTGGMISYSTSKAAVACITRSLAEEVKNDDILINAVLPSLMDTPANRKSMPDADYSKWPKVPEVAQAMVFLASPQNALTSGALVPVYGKM
ncbi:MAG TPA: SDR family NAD(P)-dependent oxidoreductase [Tepidisphaeraceae bacterium]|jgi:NAD(P)-dependent dehydrogenase (short-subunit alcohol dehydrogenase family)